MAESKFQINKVFPKDRFIDKIPDASDDDKERYKSLFRKNRQLESSVNWHNRKELTKANFDKIYEDYYRLKDIKYQFENSDFYIIAETEEYLFVQILTYNGAVYVNSFNCGGQGAKWCTGASYSIKYWAERIYNDFVLILAYNKKDCAAENERKFMLEYNANKKKLYSHAQDNEPEHRIYGRKVIKKFKPPFKFSKYHFKNAKKCLQDFFLETELCFLDGYRDFFDENGLYNNENNIFVKLISSPKSYFEFTVNDIIFWIVKSASVLKAKNPVCIEISSRCCDDIKFKTDFGDFFVSSESYDEICLSNIVSYSKYGKKIDELINLKGSLECKNFAEFIENYDKFKKRMKKLPPLYKWELDSFHNNIMLEIKNEDENDSYYIEDFSYISEFVINKDFCVRRLRLNTNRFYIMYGIFKKCFDIDSLCEENFRFLEKFMNLLRGFSEKKVKSIFKILQIDRQGNVLYNEKIIDDIKELKWIIKSEV